MHLAEAGEVRGGAQPFFGEGIVLVVFGEPRRTPEQRAPHVDAVVLVGAPAHLAQEHADELFEPHQPVADARLLEARDG